MEFWNFFTHFLAALFGLFVIYKIIHLRLREFIFSVCLCVCLSFSAAYHFCLLMGSDNLSVRKLDQCGVFLLIAGTSTAVFRSKISMFILWVCTLCFILGIVGSAVMALPTLTVAYLLFGWICTMWALGERWKSWDIIYICLGSGIMTLGSLINLYDYQYGHVVFHLLTLIGSLFYLKLIFVGTNNTSTAPENIRRFHSDLGLEKTNNLEKMA